MRITIALVLLLGSAAVLAAAPQTPAPKLHTLDETEVLVKAVLAAELKVRAAAVAVVTREERRWPDADFGCAPRKGVFEPVPTDGFAFTLAHGGQRYTFRTDKYGHVRRCPAGKPRAQGY